MLSFKVKDFGILLIFIGLATWAGTELLGVNWMKLVMIHLPICGSIFFYSFIEKELKPPYRQLLKRKDFISDEACNKYIKLWLERSTIILFVIFLIIIITEGFLVDRFVYSDWLIYGCLLMGFYNYWLRRPVRDYVYHEE